MNIWYPPAIRHLGPTWKQGYQGVSTNLVAGAILHSMEGYEWGAIDQLLNGPVSWHFSVLKDGRVLQHYTLDAVTWHAGVRYWNTRLVGIEHEGLTGQPFTEQQILASRALVEWIAAEAGWSLERDLPLRTLWEHREVNTTQCPSGRVPWERYLPTPEPPVPEEPEVKTRPLDQAETIAALNAIAKAHGDALNDSQGQTILEVIEGAPYPAPAGTRWYLATGKD